MAAGVSVRAASAADVDAIVGLMREYWRFENIEGFDAARLARVLADFFARPQLGAAWIAERDANPVGYLVACYVYSLEHGGLTAEIDELFVVAGSRGGGAGTRMLEAAEAEFRSAGCTNVALQ